MKNVTIIFAIIFSSSCFSVISAQSEMTITRSFQTTGIHSDLELGFSADSLEVVEWHEDFIRLEVKISSNVSEEMLKKLVTIGRYGLSFINNSFLMAKTVNAVIVKGVEVKEFFKVKVFVPKGFTFQIFPSLANR